MSSIIEKLKSFISKKFLGTILTSIILMVGIDISPELQAQLQTAIWSVYVVVQGYIDSKSKK